jgi:hypothetical protein
MAEAAVQLNEEVNTLDKGKGSEEAPQESPQQDSKPEDKETSEITQEVKPKVPGVPVDKDGKRPSDNTIDFDQLKELLPEDVYNTIDQRFRSLYKQTKAQDRYLDQLGKDLDKKLSDLAEKDSTTHKSVKELTDVVTKLSSEDQSAKLQLEINQLNQQKAQAYQDMDFEAVAKIDTQIMQKLAQPKKLEIPKAEPVVQTQEPQTSDNVEAELPAFTPREQAYINEWANEMSQDGMNYTRPWAQDWHPMNKFALEQTKALLSHPQFKEADLETILTTVDNIMTPPQQQAQEQPKKEGKTPPEVLSADDNLRTKKTEGKLTLTSDQMMVAERLYPKETKENAHKKYLGGLKKLQSL